MEFHTPLRPYPTVAFFFQYLSIGVAFVLCVVALLDGFDTALPGDWSIVLLFLMACGYLAITRWRQRHVPFFLEVKGEIIRFYTPLSGDLRSYRLGDIEVAGIQDGELRIRFSDGFRADFLLGHVPDPALIPILKDFFSQWPENQEVQTEEED